MRRSSQGYSLFSCDKLDLLGEFASSIVLLVWGCFSWPFRSTCYKNKVDHVAEREKNPVVMFKKSCSKPFQKSGICCSSMFIPVMFGCPHTWCIQIHF